MRPVREIIGGLGNLMFKEAFMIGKVLDGEIPDEYVQSVKYWQKHKDVIRRHFADGVGFTDAVSIHVRRGDYLKTDFYVDLAKTDYYKRAIELFPERKFIIFCKDNQGWEQDKADRQWCRGYFTPLLGDNFEMVSKDTNEIEDLNYMASCGGHIGANSSFSWWACFLGNGQCVMPDYDKWFTDGVKRIELLPEWTLL